ncbi:DUF4150 domain-containing protein [Nautilia lithotrophica]
MYLLTLNEGMNLAVPDVCLTPTPGGPVPTPYPNISNPAEANGATAAENLVVDGAKALNLTTEITSSQGDEAGSNGGVVSGEIMGPTRFLMGSEKLFINGMPAVRVTSETGQNGETMNAVGSSLVPTQTIVLVLG